ncbi:pyridoxal phosphate-dependent transferase [Jimgerdemannia flammicorona]|uniref:Pyridoxal phosphate-dependent transferase n=1 Tax=Jimgerdemannia flammicorona TaxID=994334 RepID=A0A433QS14_9FUNG|nr:pyridoxal phosphate-dependent transferase [Jimgerdemannia flammicorona]
MVTPLLSELASFDKSFSTLSLHADAHLADSSDIAPAIGVSTTFRFPDPDVTHRHGEGLNGEKHHIYSRESTNNRDRLEIVLGTLNEGHSVTYASGLAAGFAAVIHLRPNRVAIRGGYHGTHGFLKEIIDIDSPLLSGDLVWLESPHNPDGLIFGKRLMSRSWVPRAYLCLTPPTFANRDPHPDIAHYVERSHAVGAKVLVDATFAPPPLQYPFRLGVDVIMHSTTKYFSGHSDGLGGLLVVRSKEEADEVVMAVYSFLLHYRESYGNRSVHVHWRHRIFSHDEPQLRLDRTYTGSVLGSLETWLLLRSASDHKEHDGIPAHSIHSVLHSSLQHYPQGWDVEKQHPGGHGATFSVLVTRLLPMSFCLMQPATSLGAIESLIEWRYPVDPTIDQRLVRVSVGLEDLEDLKEDWRRALKKVIQEAGTETGGYFWEKAGTGGEVEYLPPL